MATNLWSFKQGGRAYVSGMTKEENPYRRINEQGTPGVSDSAINDWDKGWQFVNDMERKNKK